MQTKTYFLHLQKKFMTLFRYFEGYVKVQATDIF